MQNAQGTGDTMNMEACAQKDRAWGVEHWCCLGGGREGARLQVETATEMALQSNHSPCRISASDELLRVSTLGCEGF